MVTQCAVYTSILTLTFEILWMVHLSHQVADGTVLAVCVCLRPHSPPNTSSKLLTSVAACPLRATGCCLLVTCSLLQVNSCMATDTDTRVEHTEIACV